MTVAEIKAKLPEAEVYELTPDATYLIIVDPNLVSKAVGIKLAASLLTFGVKPLFVFANDPANAIRILEVKP